jgi:hypothetical protein
MTEPAPPPHCHTCTCAPRQTGSAWLYSEDGTGRQHHTDDLPWIRTMPTVPPMQPSSIAIGIAVAALCIALAALALMIW